MTSKVYSGSEDAGSREMFVYLSSASLSFNLGVLLFAATGRLMSSAHQRWGTREPVVRFWREADGTCQEQVARLVAHTITGLTIMAMSAVAMVTSSVTTSPFVYHGDKEFILVVCSAAVGRYLFLLATEIYSRHAHTTPRDLYINYLHHLATITCYIGVMSYAMNLFLALASVFMELDHFIYLTLNVVRRKKLQLVSEKAIMGINIGGLVTGICFRAAWPIASCALAFYYQRAITMDPGAVGILCFGMLFFGVFNIWVMKNWIMLVAKGKTGNEYCSSHKGQSIRNDLTPKRNDLTPKHSRLKVKGDIVLDQMAKENNVHTVCNLQSNFSNQLWSKEARTVNVIGGTKATNGHSELAQLTGEEDSNNE